MTRPEDNKHHAEVDLDEPDACVGDGFDNVYVGVGEGPDGWYVSAVVDSDTGSFVDSLVTDDGPYTTQAEALEAGKNAGREWCYTNNVATGDPDPDCYSCRGTGKVQGFGHTGDECPCTTAKSEI